MTRDPDGARLRRAPEALRQRAHAGGEQGMTRIAFIGAGSVVFTKNLLGDILDFPALREVEIALHDIDADRLETAEAMARYVAARARGEPDVSRAHLDRRAALDGLRLRPEHGADRRATKRRCATSRSPPATACARRSPTRSGSAASSAPCAPPSTCSRSGTSWPSSARARPGCSTTRTRWRRSASSSTRERRRRTSSGSATPCSSRSRSCASSSACLKSEVTFLVGGHQPPGVHPSPRARRREPLPAARRAHRGDAELQRRVRVALYRRLGFYPTESSEHAAEYVPWFMTPRRRDRALPDPGRRVHQPQRGEPRGVRAREGCAVAGRGDPLERSNEYAAVDRQLDRDRRADRRLRQRRRTRGLIPELPDGRLRRGSVPRRPHRRSGRPRCPATPRSSRAEPHLRERRRADRARGARGPARPRPPCGDARSGDGRGADARRDRRALRRADPAPTAT